MVSDKIRVVHNYPVWLPQTQTWMFTQVKFLPDEFEAHVVCDVTSHLDQFFVPNIHCLKDASRLGLYFEKIFHLVAIRHPWGFLSTTGRKIQADIVHSHFGNIGWEDQKAVEKIGAKHVVTFYGYDMSMLPFQDKRWKVRYRDLFEKADLFLCEGPHMARKLVQLGCSEQKLIVQHLGVETDSIPFRPRRWNTGIPLRILIAASFQEKKGIPYALQALARLKDSLPIEITIIGDATSERNSLREKRTILETIDRNDLKSKTRLLGYQPYSVLFDEAYKHHVFISPSVTASDGNIEGGAPVTLIEMIATGMPVISTLHCDIPEVVQYEMKDWLVNERDVSGLLNKLNWLINNPAQWNKMLIRGREHIEKNFSGQRQGESLGKIYKELL